MKANKKILGNSLIVIIVTFMIAVLIFTLKSYGQETAFNNDLILSGAGNKTELTTGSWVLTNSETKVFNQKNITKWDIASNEISGNCSWKDILDIVHTVDCGFQWDTPPKSMVPGAYMNIEAKYINVEYSTTANIKSGIKMFFDKVGANYLATNPESIEVMKVNKDGKQYSNEVKKGFFVAPKTLFDETTDCQLIVDCYVGSDHYVTTYTYSYQP